MIYFAWQLSMKDVNDSVSIALQRYIAKHGLPEQILLEVSDQLEPVKLPDGMNIVIRSIRVPKNIILIGETNEAQMGVPLASE